MTSDAFTRLRDQAAQRLRENPPPVLLSKADALEYAAQCLDKNAGYLAVVDTLLKIRTDDPAAAPVVAAIKQHAVEPELQLAAMKAASSAIRELALEERVVAARAERNGASR